MSPVNLSYLDNSKINEKRMEDMNFDLLEVPAGYKTDLALVIAPYFDIEFAKRMIKNLSPKRVRFVVDDGARDEDVAALKKSCKKTDVIVAMGAARGIVHLKGFYFEFVKSRGRMRRKRRFLFGSANATKAAFNGDINAELLAEVGLSLENDGELLEYLGSILNAVENDEVSYIKPAACESLRHSPTLYLPSFRVSPAGLPPGFDSWLQRGFLVAQFNRAPDFLSVKLRLRSPLPRGHLAEIFSARGVIPEESQSWVRYPYIGEVIIDEGDDSAVRNWKAFYCMWTHLGEWVSDDCYRKLGSTMQSRSAPSRKAKVDELLKRGKDRSWKNARRKIFLDILRGIWSDLDAADINPSDYLPSDASGLDTSACREKFDNSICKDLMLAADDDFRRRYVDGYEFPKLPRFRQDSAAWESFVVSLGESIAVEAMKPGSQSKLAGALHDTFDAMDLDLVEMDPAEIVSVLRTRWEHPVSEDEPERTVGDCASEYFSR